MSKQMVAFYYRDGCHLCEDMAALLFRCWPEQAARMEWRDVDSNAQWRLRHGLEVPVLTVDDTTVSALRPDVERIAQYFGAMVNPL